jgi:hypothetical protein
MLVFIEDDPRWDPLRDHPRFQAIARAVAQTRS